MAPTFSPHLVVQIDNPSQMLPNQQQAPIVVSELDSEIESGEERDDLEELNDFTSLLMPAARKSAARRLGALNSPIARKHQQDGKQKKQNAQRNSVPASKFPVIDEDLLMLATRRLPIDGFSAIPPPNLCRLITNVSEARWTTKKPMEHPKSLLEHRPQKERPKSVGHLPIPRGANCEFSQAPAQNMTRKNHLERIRINAPGNTIAHGTLPRLNDETALRRMSAASGFTTTAEESANCDCTSLAFAAFRSNWMMAMRRKKWQTKQRTEEGDDAYSKASLPSTRTPDSSTNDSGISTSSSVSSRSASLADTAQCRLHLPRLQTPKLSCSRCGVKISLPPKASPVGGNRMTDSTFRRRRRRWLSYLLGNMMKMLEKEKPNDVQKERHCCHGVGVDLKLLTVPATAQSRNIAFTVPLINVQMAEEDDGKAAPESSAENNSGTNASGDKSPRWCADPNDAVKKGNRLQWERPKKSGSASSIMVQHQHLINGLITPMVVNSTKVPQAQFITASVSSIVSGAIKLPEKLLGKDAAEETELPTRKEPEGIAEMDIRVAGKLAASPRFHFSAGRPVSREENERVLLRIRELFESRPRAQLLLDDFDELCRRMDFAVYSKRAVFDACCCSNGLPVLPILASTLGDVAEGAEKAEGVARGVPIDFNQFCVYWNRMISEAHDEASRFVFTLSAVRHSHQSLTPPQQRHILSEDFVPMMMDLILTHPGLHFLKEAPQFYSRYADVVIVRIFWNVNRSWTGKISANELRRSNFLQTFRLLDEVQDINKVTDFFSYEHFYVTYCKFWELDTDHDMIISRDDMRRHCNGALTDRIIDRIFSAAVIRTPPEQRTVPQPMGPIRQQPIEAIGFEDFVCFLLAEEDKRHPTSIEYWFRCIDLDGDGQISLYEMEYFYEAIEQKLLAKGMETLALRDVICNLLDSIFPENGHFVTRMDLKRSGLSHRFFNTFVNWIKYVDQESSDGDRASVKTNEDKELSDWEMFCLSEYELLMSETEQTSNEGDVDENIDVILDDEEEEGERVPIADDKRPRVDENGPVGENVFSTTLQRQQTAKALM